MTKKSTTFRFTTSTTPETEVTLSGRKGQPLSITLNDGRSSMGVSLDTDSIVRLHTFLADFLQNDPVPSTQKTYVPSGRAMAIMDGDSLDIRAVFKASDCAVAGCETDSFESLCAKAAGLQGVELPARSVFIFFDLFDGFIGVGTLSRILKACASYQVNFIRTGDFKKARPMTLEDIETFTNIDLTIISRTTGNVTYLSQAGTFTLNSSDPSLDTPSLFDEAIPKTDGGECSRKEVMSVLRDIIRGEDIRNPIIDEDLADLLKERGYLIARRTVVKYRDLMGIPKSCRRRA
jgi:hypothetical protein